MARSNFYTPNYNDQYGSDNYGWKKTPFVKDFLDPEIPQGVYTAFLADRGLGGFDRKSQWARGLYGQTQSGYQAALRENPALTYLQYLGKQFGTTGLNNMWAGLAPQQRGESPGMWAGPSRVIPWG
jgi:hypothetical protein